MSKAIINEASNVVQLDEVREVVKSSHNATSATLVNLAQLVSEDSGQVVPISSGPQGIRGEKGEPGTSGVPTAFIHEQTVAATVWTINHGFGRYVSVQLYDSSGCLVHAAVVYIDPDNIEVRAKVPFAGRAIIF